jgi:hypothetical protein
MELPIDYLYGFLFFLVFISGFFVLLNNNIRIFEVEYFNNSPPLQNDNCPNMLVKRDGKYYLFSPHFPNSPTVFQTLDEYAKYIQTDTSNCPVLFLQKENDPQGNDVYRIRRNPFYIEGGLPPLPLVVHDNSVPIIEEDASRDNGFNQNMFPGFDPYGLYVGRYTDKDVIHDSTSKHPEGSFNPMDSNWKGVIDTQRALEDGKVPH